MTTLHERALILAREICATDTPASEGTKALILDGSWDRTPEVQSALAAILRTTELAAEMVGNHAYSLLRPMGAPTTSQMHRQAITSALRDGAHLKKATTHD